MGIGVQPWICVVFLGLSLFSVSFFPFCDGVSGVWMGRLGNILWDMNRQRVCMVFRSTITRHLCAASASRLSVLAVSICFLYLFFLLSIILGFFYDDMALFFLSGIRP